MLVCRMSENGILEVSNNLGTNNYYDVYTSLYNDVGDLEDIHEEYHQPSETNGGYQLLSRTNKGVPLKRYDWEYKLKDIDILW